MLCKFVIDKKSFNPYISSQVSFRKINRQLVNTVGFPAFDPKQAYETNLDALVAQIETRVTSAGNSEAYFCKHSGNVVPMLSGATIFQTIHPCEDYSIPSHSNLSFHF
jgi:hypothetical protein